MRSHRAIVAAALLLPLLSCGDSTAPPAATTIELEVAEVSFDALGVAVPVLAVVKDQQGNVMPSTFPTWSTNSASVATVNSAGTVTSIGNGTATLTASSGSAEATVQVTVEQVPIAFGLAAAPNGNGLSATRGVPVPVRPAVRLLDDNGRGLANETVTFTVLAGGGTAPTADAVTDANGVARVASWTLGPDVGVNTLEASFGGFSPVVFTVNGIEDPCTAAGAELLALGVSDNGSLLNTDCVASLKFYDLYRFVLGAPSGVVIEMTATHDAYLVLLAADNTTIIAEHDDIVPGVITDSRMGVALAAGTYYLRATSYDVGQTGTYTLSARTALIGVPASVIVNAGNGQIATAGVAPIAPSVKVIDELGDPVANVAVTFATVPGVGSATGVDAVTNAEGIASVGSWTLAAGANVLTATVTGGGVVGNPFIFTSTATANPAGFNISLRFQNIPTQAQLEAFSNAVVRWETIITGDLAPITVAPTQPFCPDSPVLDETIDDLLIFVQLVPIDGPSNVLGSAGPCLIRATGQLPLLGLMRFDTADIDRPDLPSVILHEMGHVLGIGTIWALKGLLIAPSLPNAQGADTHFAGAQAVAAFNAAGGNVYVGGKVPVENVLGGAGTRDGHWREGQLLHELMTGYLTGPSQPLSAITIRSLQDLGYTVSVATADAYTFIPQISAAPSQAWPTVHLVGDILSTPPRVYHPSGRPTKRKPGTK